MPNLSFTKIIADDLEAEAAFYVSVFNLKQLDRITMSEPIEVDEIVLGTGKETGAALVVVEVPRGEKATKAGMLGFMCTDLDATIGKATALGAKLTLGPMDIPNGDGRLALLDDPEGQIIEIIQQSAPA